MNLERVRDLLPEYALGLLEEQESRDVEAWLERHPELRRELLIYQEAADALTLSADPEPLPRGAAERILRGVRAQVAEEGAAEREIEAREQESARITEVRPAGNARWWRSAAVVSSAATVLLSIGLVIAVVAWTQARGDGGGDESTAAAIELELEGSAGNGVIFVASDFGHGVAVFLGLEPAPDDHHYELWSEGPDGHRKAAAFQGTGENISVALPALPRDMTRMFVTVEVTGADAATPSDTEVLTTP